MNSIINNVRTLLDRYPNKLTTNNKLVLMYWKEFDDVFIDSDHISTKDFLTKVTIYDDIINALAIIVLQGEQKW